MNLAPLLAAIQRAMDAHPHVLMAIDGPCASGKSTLAAQLGDHYQAPVLHMDDFFLPPALRTQERLSQPGGNVDRERFFSQVLSPLSQQAPTSYRPWRCQTGTLGEEIFISPAPLTIVEGAYALHPDLREHYHLRVFLTAPLPLREARLRQRNGPEGLETFQARWIPLENAYFQQCAVEDCCHVHLSF